MSSGPVVDERFAESMAYNESHPMPAIMVQDSLYRIYVGADSHVDSTNRNIRQFVRAYRSDKDCPLALHLGDVINAQNNYPNFMSALGTMPDTPIVGKQDTLLFALGNHDILFGQWRDYKQFFQRSVYCFETQLGADKLDLFICLDTGSGTLGTKQMAWLRDLLESHPRSNYRHVIVFTHTNFFNRQDITEHSTNYSIEETQELTHLLSHYGVSMVWTGHEHKREIVTFGDVVYITLDTMQDPVRPAYYMVANMDSEINYQFIAL